MFHEYSIAGEKLPDKLKKMKLGKIMIFVSDMAEAKRFYSEVLGFPVKSETVNRVEFFHPGCDFVASKHLTNNYEV